MRVLLVGEGKHDIGVSHEWSSRQRQYVSLPGWLHEMLEKLNPPGLMLQVSAIGVREIVLTQQQRRRHMPLPHGYGVKALAAMYRASFGKYDVLIFMVDTDSKNVTEWKSQWQSIDAGLRIFPGGPVCVICLPKCASESWLMSDVVAWQKLGLKDTAIIPKEPETRWGDRHDPKGHHPKHDFERAVNAANLSGDGRECRIRVLHESEISTMMKNCPVSFVPFLNECVSAGLATKHTDEA